MKTRFLSLQGAVTLSVLSILVFLGRTFIDFYYVYREINMSIGSVSGAMLANMALFGGWIWGLLAAVQGSRRGLATAFGFSLFFLIVIAIGTLVSYCPSPCQTGWPLGEIMIWLSLIFGLLSTLGLGIQLWGQPREQSLGAAIS